MMKVLVFGLGSIARKHIAALRKIDPEVEIAALRSSRKSVPEDGVSDLYTLDEARAFTPDFAIISTPTAIHSETIRSAMRLGVPLFIEKPLVHSLEDTSIATEIKAAGTLHYIACNLRFLECLEFVKKAVETRGVGINEVNSYCGSWLPDWRPGTDFRKTYSALPEMGGGVHIDLIHEIDYICWIFGQPARTTATLRNNSSLGIEAIDYANYCLVYPGFCASVILNYFRRDYKRTLEIVWEDETWLVDLPHNRITSGSRVIFESSQTIPDTYECQLRYFISLIKRGSTHSLNEVSDAVITLRAALGVF